MGFTFQFTTREHQASEAGTMAKNVRYFCLNADFHVTFRNLLHAVKLRHWTGDFAFPPKKGVLRIFSPKKTDGFGRVQTRVPKVSTLPLDHRIRYIKVMVYKSVYLQTLLTI
jgi:hypothetical protein